MKKNKNEKIEKIIVVIMLLLCVSACSNGKQEEKEPEKKTVSVELTTENWKDYFEEEIVTDIKTETNGFGEVEGLMFRYYLVLKDDIAQRADFDSWTDMISIEFSYVYNQKRVDFTKDGYTVGETVTSWSETKIDEHDMKVEPVYLLPDGRYVLFVIDGDWSASGGASIDENGNKYDITYNFIEDIEILRFQGTIVLFEE